MKKLSLMLASLVVVGCSSGSFSAKSNSGSIHTQEGTVIRCDGYKSWPHCYKSAKQYCPGGYEIISKEENMNMQSRFLRISCK